MRTKKIDHVGIALACYDLGKPPQEEWPEGFSDAQRDVYRWKAVAAIDAYECDSAMKEDMDAFNAAPAPKQADDCPSDKDTIIKLQKHRIEHLEQAIGLAKDDYYDKGDDYGIRLGDGELWEHPLMANLMAVLARDGHTPMGKDTQICLVKAALRSMPERESRTAAWNHPARSSDELVTQIRKLGSLIPCRSGGTFENDPPDAILAAAIECAQYLARSGDVKQVDDCRETFEVEFRKYPWPLLAEQLRQDESGNYKEYNALIGWLFWQAAWNHPARADAEQLAKVREALKDAAPYCPEEIEEYCEEAIKLLDQIMQKDKSNG